MAARPVLAFGLCCFVVLLAGCSSTPRPPAPGATSQAAHPGYKIGSPYQIGGTWYYPAEDWSYDETGIASWYGEQFHGKYTANGEIFDLNSLTAAHRTLPMPSIVRVTNLENGRSIDLRVNDRGPYARGRILDLSRRAAQLLGFEGSGVAKVRVKILVPETIQARSLLQSHDVQLASVAPATPAPVAPVDARPLAAPPGVRVAAAPPPPLPLPAPPPAPAVIPAAMAPVPELSGQVTTVRVKPTNIFVQAGAFSRPDNAVRLKTKLSTVQQLGEVKVTDTTVNGANLYRVRIGPIGSVDEADRVLNRVVDSGVPEARIVVD